MKTLSVAVFLIFSSVDIRLAPLAHATERERLLLSSDEDHDSDFDSSSKPPEAIHISNSSQAGSDRHYDAVALPQSCDHEPSITKCAVAAGENPFPTKVGAVGVILDSYSVAIRLKETLRLVKGQIWIRADRPFTVESVFGKIIGTPGEFVVALDLDRVTALAVTSSVQMQSRDKTINLYVPNGFQNWMGGKTHQPFSGIPLPIQRHDFLYFWWRLYSETQKSSKDDFLLSAQAIFTYWQDVGQRSAQFIESYLASLQTELDRKKQIQLRARQAQIMENQRFRQMFRDRNP